MSFSWGPGIPTPHFVYRQPWRSRSAGAGPRAEVWISRWTRMRTGVSHRSAQRLPPRRGGKFHGVYEDYGAGFVTVVV